MVLADAPEQASDGEMRFTRRLERDSMNAAPTLAPMLRKLRLWVSLDAPQEQALLDLPHTVVALEKQRVIVRGGADVTHAWLVLSGYCVRFK